MLIDLKAGVRVCVQMQVRGAALYLSFSFLVHFKRGHPSATALPAEACDQLGVAGTTCSVLLSIGVRMKTTCYGIQRISSALSVTGRLSVSKNSSSRSEDLKLLWTRWERELDTEGFVPFHTYR